MYVLFVHTEILPKMYLLLKAWPVATAPYAFQQRSWRADALGRFSPAKPLSSQHFPRIDLLPTQIPERIASRPGYNENPMYRSFRGQQAQVSLTMSIKLLATSSIVQLRSLA